VPSCVTGWQEPFPTDGEVVELEPVPALTGLGDALRKRTALFFVILSGWHGRARIIAPKKNTTLAGRARGESGSWVMAIKVGTTRSWPEQAVRFPG